MTLPSEFSGSFHRDHGGLERLIDCTEPVRIAVIGGTGLSHLSHEGFTPLACLTIETPYGSPSSPITILRTPHNVPVAFLSRHGLHHELTPSEVPNCANIAALRSIGVRSVISFSAVGSLREEIKPRDFILPDQIIDRTKGIRPFTFFEGGCVAHVGFAEPFDKALRKVVVDMAKKVEGGPHLHTEGTLICMGLWAIHRYIFAFTKVCCRRSTILYSRRINALQVMGWIYNKYVSAA